ncbi:FAD-linked oxidoreductase [Mycena rebaudengoi]|nr:FAD-linked oxidoreductase [Mycena rebaudengoi]
MCSIPALTFTAVPGLRWITEALVRITFFRAFPQGLRGRTLILLHRLGSANTGALFAYSVEVDEAEALPAVAPKAVVDEMLRCIDVAADFEDRISAKQTGRRTWVTVKITALLPDTSAFIRLSSHILTTCKPTSSPNVVFPGNPTVSDLDVLYTPNARKSTLTNTDLLILRDLHADLELICTGAEARSVRIIIDAEYLWYQPTLDALTLALMRRFNALDRRGPQPLLVRGAYHMQESAAHLASPATSGQALSISPEAQPPVWARKADTDAQYDACAEVLLDTVAADAKDGAAPRHALWDPQLGQLREDLRGTGGAQARGVDGRGQPARAGERRRVGEVLATLWVMGYGMCDALIQYLVKRTDVGAAVMIKYLRPPSPCRALFICLVRSRYVPYLK